MGAIHKAVPIERFDTIDLLRGISVLGVVYLHITVTLFYLTTRTDIPGWLQIKYGDFGQMGVSCFFAISGFLITLTSIRRYGTLAALRPLSFYRIRFARIAPPLILLVVILSGLHLARVSLFVIDPKVSTLPKAIFAVLTFQMNREQALHGWFPPSWVPLWTLSVEEMFYLCFPIVCVLLLRRRWSVPLFFIVLVALVVMGPVARCGPNVVWAQHSYLGNMDNIALGCLTGFFAAHLRLRSTWKHSLWVWSLRITGAALIVFADASPLTTHPHLLAVQSLLWKTSTSVSVLGLGTCMVMLASVAKPLYGLWLTAPVRLAGRYSYEIYLYHSFVLEGLILLSNKVPRVPLTLWAMAMILLSGIMGFLISRFVSEPMNRLLRGARLPSQLRAVQHGHAVTSQTAP